MFKHLQYSHGPSVQWGGVRQQDAQWKLALGKFVKQTATHSYIVLRMPRDLERGNQIVDL